jgi:hypothetical protein
VVVDGHARYGELSSPECAEKAWRRSMKLRLLWIVLTALTIWPGAARADKPRVFITESQSAQLTGDAAAGDVKGSLSFTGGTSPNNIEVMKHFMQRCPDVIVTANRDKADYVVRLDHADVGPTTPFVRGNKVAVFTKSSEDLIYSGSTRFLGNAVKGACAAITRSQR